MKRFLDTLNYRPVEVDDAEFILSLRLDERYNQYLKPVSADIEQQRNWLRNYKEEEKSGLQYYYIVERKDGTPCGKVRIYDFQGDSFCWGSLIMNENKTKYAFLETAFYVYDFAFNVLGFKKSHFDVRKGNARVLAFHDRMGAVRTGEDEENYYFEITPEAVKKAALRAEAELAPGSAR